MTQMPWVLKSTAKAAAHSCVRLPARNVIAFKDDLTAIRPHKASSNIKESTFPSTIRSDDTGDAPFVNLQGRAVNGSQSSERESDVC
jgi:hypothetical protein